MAVYVSSGYTGHTVSVSTVVVFVPKLNHRSTGDWAFRKIISMESYKQAFVLTPEILPFESFFCIYCNGVCAYSFNQKKDGHVGLPYHASSTNANYVRIARGCCGG